MLFGKGRGKEILTRLAVSNLQFKVRVAGRRFQAKCGCTIPKGEPYLVTDDYAMYQNHHSSECVAHAQKNHPALDLTFLKEQVKK